MLTLSARRLENRSNLYRQWASLLESGVPMVRALRTLDRAAADRGDRRIVRATADAIERGATLAEGLDASGRRLPPLDRALLEVGERTGRLERCLVLLADTTWHQARLVRDVAGGITYPLVVLHTALLLFPISSLLGLVLRGEVGAFVADKTKIFALLYGVLFAVGWLGPRILGSQSGRVVEALLRRVPVLGRGLYDLALARLAMALRAQFEAGITAIEAWSLAGEVCGSPAIRAEVRRWGPALDRGATPGELAAASPRIDGLFSQFYLTGETSGKLDDALVHIESCYSDAGRDRLKAFALWLPRIVYGLVVLYIAYVVINFWTGYFAQIGEVLSP